MRAITLVVKRAQIQLLLVTITVAALALVGSLTGSAQTSANVIRLTASTVTNTSTSATTFVR